jgi:hypothetical protein
MQTDEPRPGPAMTDRALVISAVPPIAVQLRELADRARRLPPPNHRDPHAFHEARSELGHDLEVLAEQLSGSAR